MTLEKQEFSRQYSLLMVEYAQSFDEAPLLAIEKLGQEMIQSNIPPEDIAKMHDVAIGELMAAKELSPDRIRAASLPLMRLLTAYGVAFRAQQSLKKSEILHRGIMLSACDAIIIADRTGKILEVNPAAVDTFGYPLEELQRLEVIALVPEHLRQQHEHGFRNFIETGKYNIIGQRVETEALHQDGHIFPIGLSLSELNHGQGKLMAVIRDVSEQKKAENALIASEKRHRTLFESSRDAIMILKETCFIDGNHAAINMFGCDSLDHFTGKHPSDFSPPHQPCGTDSRTLANKRITTAMKNGSAQFEWMHKRADGEEFPTEVLLSALELNGKRVLQATVRDVTDRKLADETVRKLSSAIEQAGESVVITDRNGIIEYINSAFSRITGYSAEEAIGQTPRILKSGNQDAAFYEAMWGTITSGKVWHGKVIDRRKDGSFYPAMLTISPICDDSGDATHYTHFIGIQSDLSALEDMEQRFHQAQKMEAVGTMVGGIAHNFNNILAGMSGNLYLAKRQVRKNPEVVQKLDNVEELSEHAAEMIQQLLAFARKGVVIMQEVPLAPFINETLKLLHASVPENIVFHQDICSDALPVKGDATLLHQVLVNLVNNARDAVDGVDEPSISIRLASFQTDDAFIENHPYFKAGTYAHLSVEDNGIGIPEHQLEHLFEPFFTTKEQGKGTGLGLSMVYGAMKTHHGFVEVESIKGKGSSFHIYIPLLEKAALAADSVQAIEPIHGQGELILLADDEQVVRNVMTEILESMGYRVLQAKDGLEAMELFTAHEQDLALALLDVVMPHCGGMPLAKRIRTINPDVPVLFLTGYDKEHVLHGETLMPNSEMLTKPVNFDRLSQRIRQMLD